MLLRVQDKYGPLRAWSETHSCTLAFRPSAFVWVRLFLRQTPLPIWPRVQIELVSGQGFEPRSTGSEPAVLPLDEPEKCLVGMAGLEPARFSLKN